MLYILIMSLIVEVFQKIRQLLDKPISTLTRNQIIELLNKQVVPADDAAVLFAKKYRADLLLFLIPAQPVTPQKLQYLLGVLTDKLLEFKMDEAGSLWKIILNKAEMKGVRQQWTERLLKEALKNTNQTLKTAQLQLLKENANFLWEWSQSRIFEDFAKNYCRAFTKFNIYLSPYAGLLTLLLSKAQGVKTNLIESNIRRELLCRLIQFLNVSKSKQQFLFQNQCLKACTSILSSKKTQINDVILMYACDKMLQEYLWRKPTREEAYACKQALKKVRQAVERENKDKMCRNYQPVEKQPEKPMLIEEVIDKVNGYRKNNHLIINQSYIDKTQKGSFLKRGVGNGGGKSVIVTPPTKKNVIGLADLDELVQSCFRKSNSSFISKQRQQIKQESQYLEGSMNASTIAIQEDKDFQEISNLIDLAYQFKFDQYNA